MMQKGTWIRPEIVFLAVAPLVGLACLVLTPPFQVADEPQHFFRIVQIAGGGIVGERRGDQSGGEIPSALVAMAEHFIDGDMASGQVRWERAKWADLKPFLTRRADLSARQFQDFRNMTRYAPAAYLPQSLGIGIARALDLPPLWLVYAGRACALVLFMAAAYWAIRLTPICPWGFAVLATVPAVIFQAASLSADATTNAVLFFFTAFVFRLAFAKSAVSGRDIVVLALLGLLIGLCKSVYAAATGLVFLIPAAKFRGRRHGTMGLAVVGSALLAAVLWAIAMQPTYVPSFADVDAGAQVAHVLRHPVAFLGMLLGRILRSFGYLVLGGGLGLFHEFFGLLGWYAALVPVGQTCLLVLVWCGLAEKNALVAIFPWQRAGVALILAASVVLIAAVNYAIWCPPGWPALALFGRYFHPLAPMAFLLLHNRSFAAHVPGGWKWLIPVYFVGVAWATIFVVAKTY